MLHKILTASYLVKCSSNRVIKGTTSGVKVIFNYVLTKLVFY